ncbi:16S rRNA (cytosine(1402)-N(4))-methyltransferase RsmH [Metallibacterium scheffleri]|uniref:16S rRNA (cytosine(1402)-N(4))-methyltransferase RsmH n=1 Tax=Metallibacterium scheffleri TaxID=993689 RepID=UPI0023F14588|nr:16S rRNA (cytosine(1402)-N(4))-methyltransferase RsmH [Metallibacterium scheffleri]
MSVGEHVPVMLAEVIAGLGVRAEGTYLDGTYGRGGHAAAILQLLGPQGSLLLLDRDPEAIAAARARFANDARVHIRHGSFAALAEWDAAQVGLDGVLLDLGVSSPQLDQATRGFSFMADGPLDMRMDPTQGQSAAEFLAQADAEDIAAVLWRYGEERMSRRIAQMIVQARVEQPLTRTLELAQLVQRAIGRREPGKHPATRTFQALRLHVNGELDALQRGLAAASACLKPGGRLAVISFHSLEDRLVKQFIRGPELPRVGRGLPAPTPMPGALRAVGRKHFASAEEVARNPRARSAVLRIAEKRA